MAFLFNYRKLFLNNKIVKMFKEFAKWLNMARNSKKILQFQCFSASFNPSCCLFD